MEGNREGLICAILVGGRSIRMGCHKGMITVGGRPLIARIAEQARCVTDRIYLCGNAGPDAAAIGLPAIPDVYEGRGPLAGLHAALLHEPPCSVLLLACDLPNVHSKMLERLVRLAAGYDIAVTCTLAGIPQPLCAFYRHTCKDAVENCLEMGVNRAMAILSHHSLRVRLVGPEEGNFTDSDLLNLNTPDDLKKLCEHSRDTHI